MNVDAALWAPVPGYEGWYEAHPAGFVRSVDRTVPVSNSRTRPYSIRLRGRVLKHIYHNGYPHVVLWKQHVQETCKVPNVVARTFLGPCPTGLYVCHDNGDRSGSSLANLYHGTPAQNVEDMRRHGTMCRGESTPWAKLRDADIREIRANKGGLTQKQLGERFGITQGRVSRIQRREQWKHVA